MMTKFKKALFGLAAGAALMGGLQGAFAQDEAKCWPPEVSIEHLKDGFYVLFGPGGNIGMLSGEEGVFLIDDQVKPLTDDVLAAIRSVSDGEIKFVLNTHWHGDHSGGNENLGAGGAIIVAHDKVRERLSAAYTRPSTGRTTEPLAPEGLPVITFNDQASIFIDGVEARAIHFDHAHTDGDSVVFFKDQNLIHLGDLFFNHCYPFIDTETGGGVNGLIRALGTLLPMLDDDTIVIPGHGPVTGKGDLAAYRSMLVTLRDRVEALKAEGKTLEEIKASGITADFDPDWTWNFFKGEEFLEMIFNSPPLED